MKIVASQDWLDRHPWLAASLVLHALALLALYFSMPVKLMQDGTPRIHTAQQAEQVSASLERARREQMRRQVQALERVQREMAGSSEPGADALPDDPAALRARAQQASQRILALDQQRRAQELARLLKVSPEEALRRVQADPRSGGPRPEASLTELTQDAQARLQAQALRHAAQQQGHAARSEPGAPQARTGGPASGQSGAQGQGGAGAGGGEGSSTAGLEGGRGGTLLDRRAYGPLVGSAQLDPARLRLQDGRRIGPGGPLATRVLIDRWYLVGPFDGPGPSALHTVQAPEMAVDLDAVYEGKNGRLLQWQAFSAPPYPLVPQPRHANAVYYAATELHSDRERELWLEIGADDDSKLWLNDELVWSSSPTADKPWYRRPYYVLNDRLAQRNLVEARVPVRLRAGPNRVLLKLYNGVDLTFFSLVLSP